MNTSNDSDSIRTNKFAADFDFCRQNVPLQRTMQVSKSNDKKENPNNRNPFSQQQQTSYFLVEIARRRCRLPRRQERRIRLLVIVIVVIAVRRRRRRRLRGGDNVLLRTPLLVVVVGHRRPLVNVGDRAIVVVVLRGVALCRFVVSTTKCSVNVMSLIDTSSSNRSPFGDAPSDDSVPPLLARSSNVAASRIDSISTELRTTKRRDEGNRTYKIYIDTRATE